MSKTRVLIVDDHAILRMGLASLLNAKKEVEVIGDAASGEECLRKYPKLKPDVVIMDLVMAEMDGAETTRQLLVKDPSAKVLILTTFATSDGISRALNAGAHGAIMKSADFSELLKAVLAVAAGGDYVSPEVAQLFEKDPPTPELTERQMSILSSVALGRSNKDIAKELDIDPITVREHLSAIYKKLGAATRAEAAAIALRKQLVKI